MSGGREGVEEGKTRKKKNDEVSRIDGDEISEVC